MEVLGGPHLMLAHVGGQNRITIFGQVIEAVDEILRLHRLIGFLPVTQRMVAFPFVQLIPPRFPPFFLIAVHRGTQHAVQFLKHSFAIAHDGDIHVNVLSNRGGINVNVDDFGSRTKLGNLAGDAIIKPGTHGNHQIRIMHGHVGHVRPVHAEHPQRQWMFPRKRSQRHQGLIHGNLSHFGQFKNLRGGLGQLHAAAKV